MATMQRESGSRRKSYPLAPQQRPYFLHTLSEQTPPHRELALRTYRQDKLCGVCSRINFSKYKFRKLEEDILLAPYTAPGVDCPFCRLARHLYEQKIQTADNQLTKQIAARDSAARNQKIWLTNVQSWRLGVELSPYDPTKSEKNSNEADLRARAKELHEPAYRFVLEVEDRIGKRREIGQIQYLARRDDCAEDRQFFGRELNPAAADMGLIKSWLKRCRKTHGPTCEMADIRKSQLPPGFRVIDVHRRVVIRAPSDCEYFALSYVWGVSEMRQDTGMEPVTLTSIDVGEGREETNLPPVLPRTLEDALKLTEELGCTYLWVDALCIVQDQDQSDKHVHLSRMDAVYSRASLTIVAGSGQHADIGLTGVYGNVRSSGQYIEVVKGRKMAAMLPSYSDVENSRSLTWNSRGWTLQEKLLSKRILLFTDSQVYYKCSRSIWTEQVWMESRKAANSNSSKAQMAGCYRWSNVHRDLEGRNGRRGDMLEWMEKSDSNPLGSLRWSLAMNERFTFLFDYRPKRESQDLTTFAAALRDSQQKPWFEAYLSAVEECTQRSLTDPNDMFFSMNGIFRLLGEGPGKFHYGLPQSEFRKSLLWRPVAGARMVSNQTPWPSWSWASWHFGQQGISFYHPGNEALLTILAFRALLQKLRYRTEGTAGRSDTVKGGEDDSDSETLVNSDSESEPDRRTPQKSSAHLKAQTASLSDRVDWNLKACFDQSHGWSPRPKYMYSCEKGMVQPISDILMQSEEHEDEVFDTFPSASLLSYKVPLLLMETWAVQFRIGRRLSEGGEGNKNETALFQLVDDSGRCVGETWTSHGIASRGREQKIRCITISETWTFEKAVIDEHYRPRWQWNAFGDDDDKGARNQGRNSIVESIAKLALRLFTAFSQLRHEEVFSSRIKFAQACLNKLNKTLHEKEAGPSDTETDGAGYISEAERREEAEELEALVDDSESNSKAEEPQTKQTARKGRYSRLENQPKGAFLSLLSAKKGEPVPRFLWKVVEVMLVEWEGDVAWRIGTGKIAYDAWKAAYPIPRRVMLA